MDDGPALRWRDFEAAAPDLAAAGLGLLTQFGPGLAFLATVRPDGGPRLHPFCPVAVDGALWAFVIGSSPKCADLHREPRCAVHSFLGESTDDEFLIRARARAVPEVGDELRARIQGATSANVGAEGESLFELLVERAMLARYEARGVWPPAYTIWPTRP